MMVLSLQCPRQLFVDWSGVLSRGDLLVPFHPIPQVERMKKKVPWLKYEMRERECQQLQESLRETFAARDAARSELETARRPLQYVIVLCAALCPGASSASRAVK